jgi:hypothetical protein
MFENGSVKCVTKEAALEAYVSEELGKGPSSLPAP